MVEAVPSLVAFERRVCQRIVLPLFSVYNTDIISMPSTENSNESSPVQVDIVLPLNDSEDDAAIVKALSMKLGLAYSYC